MIYFVDYYSISIGKIGICPHYYGLIISGSEANIAICSIVFIGKHKGLAIGNGIVFYGMHMIAGVGWILAPGYAVIAATLSLYKTKQQ